MKEKQISWRAATIKDSLTKKQQIHTQHAVFKHVTELSKSVEIEEKSKQIHTTRRSSLLPISSGIFLIFHYRSPKTNKTPKDFLQTNNTVTVMKQEDLLLCQKVSWNRKEIFRRSQRRISHGRSESFNTEAVDSFTV